MATYLKCPTNGKKSVHEPRKLHKGCKEAGVCLECGWVVNSRNGLDMVIRDEWMCVDGVRPGCVAGVGSSQNIYDGMSDESDARSGK